MYIVKHDVTECYMYTIHNIEYLLDLQLPMQSVPITTEVVSSNPSQGEMYSIMWYNLSVT